MSIPAPLLQHARPAWRPETVTEPGEPTGSRFSGTPWIPEGVTHPVCPCCNRPVQLFLQLNTADLPSVLDGVYGHGLIQLFYCTSEDCDVAGCPWEPFWETTVARMVASDGPGALGLEVEEWPAHHIVGWRTVEDVPNTEEASGNLEVDLTNEENEQAWASGVPHAGDKLAGWPAWIQGVEYPDCPQCRATMRLVFQLDSWDHVPFTFGDMGIGHLTQCPEHKDVLAFGWACG